MMEIPSNTEQCPWPRSKKGFLKGEAVLETNRNRHQSKGLKVMDAVT